LAPVAPRWFQVIRASPEWQDFEESMIRAAPLLVL
jgi:hypothetical protein